MQIGDLVKVSERWNGRKSYGVITNIVPKHHSHGSYIYMVTLFDGTEVALHPSKIELISESR